MIYGPCCFVDVIGKTKKGESVRGNDDATFVFATYTLEVIRKVSGDDDDEGEEKAALWLEGVPRPPCE